MGMLMWIELVFGVLYGGELFPNGPFPSPSPSNGGVGLGFEAIESCVLARLSNE